MWSLYDVALQALKLDSLLLLLALSYKQNLQPHEFENIWLRFKNLHDLVNEKVCWGQRKADVCAISWLEAWG